MSTVLERLSTGDLPLDFNWQKDKHSLSAKPCKILPEPTPKQAQKVKIVSEDLRDGLHGVAEYPDADQMLEYVGKLDQLGVDTMTVGIFPGVGNKIDRTIKSLLGKMRDKHPNVTPIVLTQASEAALNWLGDCKQINPQLNSIVFMGTAPSRLLVEEWSQEFILKQLGWAVDYAANKLHVDVIGATEHTTQTPPDFLKKIITTQVESGAKYFCIADTIGIARPRGAYRLVRFTKDTLKDLGAEDVLVDWHGHRDMGNDLGNAMAAISAGADRVHTVAGGIGERAGNTQMETVLLNLNAILQESHLKTPWNLGLLADTLEQYYRLTNTPASEHGPLSVRSTRTSLGIHTAAIFKAEKLAREAQESGNQPLAIKLNSMANTIYSAVNPQEIGRSYEIGVGPWSGSSTVRLAALVGGLNPDNIPDDTIQRILSTAKQFGRELTNTELRQMLENHT